jgi:hypothetical protein
VAKPDPMTLYADTILVDGWCLRSALVRYAQAEPVRSTVVHALMRRLDAALAAPTDRAPLDALAAVVERFDELARTMSTWAADRTAHPVPNESVDLVCAEAASLYEQLGVPEESVDPAEWRGMRSSEGRRPPRAAK